MNREEFFMKMQDALEGEVSASVIRSNLDYYRSYIGDEMAKGRSEEDVLNELGDPRLIAHTIVDSQDAAEGHYGQEHYVNSESDYEEPGSRFRDDGGLTPGSVWNQLRPKLILIAIAAVLVLVVGVIFRIAFQLVISPFFWTLLAVIAIWRIITH